MKIKTILLVDKDPSVAESIAISLGHKGVMFYFAPDLKTATLILTDHADELDLVVADVEPRGHAVALLKTIKSYRDAGLPMIVLGSAANLRANAEALGRGKCHLMRMPLDRMQLWMSVASLDGTEPVLHPLENNAEQLALAAA